jgi:hypothetical protein
MNATHTIAKDIGREYGMQNTKYHHASRNHAEA